MKSTRTRWIAAQAGAALLLAACGGGGSTEAPASGTLPPPAAPAAPSQLVGTAAIGTALPNAPVTITNSAGASPCEEATITTSALGSYTCTLKSGQTAPFFVVVTDPTGNTAPLVSIATTTPAAGAALTVNATPLTTAIVAQLASDGNALTVVNNKSVDVTALQALTAKVVTQLQPVLTSINVPSGYNPFTTSITAATTSSAGNTADLVLDVVKVVTDPATQKLALATIDNPTPVLLATTASTGSPMKAPSAGMGALSQATQLVAKQLEACFALPTSSRVLSVDTTVPYTKGGPEVTSVAAACQGFVADAANAAKIDFLHNGYNGGQFFFGTLTSDAMTGAKFSVPEIIAFYPMTSGAVAPAQDAYDRAVLNIRYIDKAGVPGNLITMASKIPGTSSTIRPSEWWLTGNQHPVDVLVRPLIRRQEQMNPANTTRASGFMTGVQISVNGKGPGSTDSTGGLAMARISGPGLPGNGAAGTGLVFKTSTQPGQLMLDLFNKTGSLTTGSQCGNGVTFNCPNLWLTRTAGITGTNATTLASNPTTGLSWAQPADAVDPSKFVKGARYKVELFYGTSTTPLHTFHKTLLADLVPSTSGVNLPWNALGAKTNAAFDPTGALAGAQAALTVDWVQNPSAQQINGVSAVVDSAGSFGPTKSVPAGAQSVVLNNVVVPAFNTSSTRLIFMNYSTTETIGKSAVYTYN
jgi:hypothetical protein